MHSWPFGPKPYNAAYRAAGAAAETLARGASIDDVAAAVKATRAALVVAETLAGAVSNEDAETAHVAEAARAAKAVVLARGVSDKVAQQIAEIITIAAVAQYRDTLAGEDSIEDARQSATMASLHVVALAGGASLLDAIVGSAWASVEFREAAPSTSTEDSVCTALTFAAAGAAYQAARCIAGGESTEVARQAAAIAGHYAGACYRAAIAAGDSIEVARQAAAIAASATGSAYCVARTTRRGLFRGRQSVDEAERTARTYAQGGPPLFQASASPRRVNQRRQASHRHSCRRARGRRVVRERPTSR